MDRKEIHVKDNPKQVGRVEGSFRRRRGAGGTQPKLLPSSPATQPVLGPLHRHLDIEGLAPPDNPAHQGSGIHAPNEHIRLSDLERAVTFARHAFTELHRAAD